MKDEFMFNKNLKPDSKKEYSALEEHNVIKDGTPNYNIYGAMGIGSKAPKDITGKFKWNPIIKDTK